jgi:lactoylglutathione lyase
VRSEIVTADREFFVSYKIHHIHIKSADPRSSADWFMAAFGFTQVSDEVRVFSDRFIRLQDASGLMIIVSGPRAGEDLQPVATEPHLGLEHLALQTADLDGDISRLVDFGGKLIDGPEELPGGLRIAFLLSPCNVRLELLQPPAPAA